MSDARATQAGWEPGWATLSTAERRARLEANPLILLPGKGSHDARRRAAWALIEEEEGRDIPA